MKHLESLVVAIAGLELTQQEARLCASGLGGVVLLDRNIVSGTQVRGLTDSIHSLNPRAIVMVDEEGGTVSRLDRVSGGDFPSAQALGFIDDISLTYEIAATRGQCLDASGIDLCLAPVADLLVGEGNPVVATRSFGSDPEQVARHVEATIGGLRAAGIAVCAKHFPGHGITPSDSHEKQATAIVNEPAVRAIHLTPFKVAVQAGAEAIMTGHVVVPDWGLMPASVSAKAHELLRTELGFKGLIISDAVDMAGVGLSPPEAAVRALKAGADLVLLGNQALDQVTLGDILDAVEEAIEEGALQEERIQDGNTRRTEFRRPPATLSTEMPDRRAEAAQRALSLSFGGRQLSNPISTVIVARPSWIRGLDISHDLTGPAVSAFPSATVTVDNDWVGVTDLLITNDSAFDPRQRELITEARTANPSTLVVETGIPPADLAPPFACLRGASNEAFLALANALGGAQT